MVTDGDRGRAAEGEARDRMLRLLGGYWHSQALHAVAKLGIADLLAGGPRPVFELAARCGAHEGSLYRLLRALAFLGVFEETAGRRFGPTPLSRLLLSGVEGSLRPAAVLGGEACHWRAWEGLLEVVRSGDGSAFERAHGRPLFDHLGSDPEADALFREVWRGFPEVDAAIAEAWDFREARVIVDIGGGDGGLLRAILRRAPGARGIVFDRPGEGDPVRGSPGAGALSARLTRAGGDFREPGLPAGDLYLLRHVLHDWDDDQAAAILENCRSSLEPGGSLLVIEHLLPEGPVGSPAALLDVTMMVLTGGRERTEAEYRRLLRRAGFTPGEVHPTRAGVSILCAMKHR